MSRNLRHKHVLKALAGIGIGLWLAGCAKSGQLEPNRSNLVEIDGGDQKKTIGENGQQFDVMNQGQLNKEIAKGKVLSLTSSEGQKALLRMVELSPAMAEATDDVTNLADDSLLVGFPVGLLSERHLFGGVITKVTDTKSEKLGGLKLTDLDPLHVQLVVSKGKEGGYSLVLLGCPSKCAEGAALSPILGIPIAGVDEAKGQLVLDLKTLGNELNLIEMLDPTGDYTELKTVSSSVVSLDYSLSTLVFDIQVKMVPKAEPVAGTAVPETTFTIRWYLRLTSVFDSSFVSRPATDGVGFFMTARSATPKIQRFAIPSTSGTQVMGIKYYLKNVPVAHQPAFASAFDAWNKKFTAIIGKPLMTYEFVEPGSEKDKLLVTGDIRYKIIEWDITNLAGYGGLGPSIANQNTGELLTANVLVQGPKIVELYSKWFAVSTLAEELMDEGRVVEAQTLLKTTKQSLKGLMGETSSAKHVLKLGKGLVFRVPSQTPELQDPLAQRDDFEPLPAGITYEKYMAGYFHELVTHEMGHNVGLRHNFRGNLAYTAVAPGAVSNSVMEYQGRNFRYVNDIGAYDVMALEYGYAGKKPGVMGLFCTDENVADDSTPNNSPECSRDDATADPVGFYLVRAARIIDLITLKGSTEAPVWMPADTAKEIKAYYSNLGLYAARAETTGATWTNFFTGGDRPASAAGVKAYVLNQVKSQLCGPNIAAVVASKATAEGKAKTETNVIELRKKVAEALKPYKVFSDEELACTP